MILQESIKGTATTQATYVGVNVKDPTHDAKKNSDLLDKITDKETQQLAGQTTGVPQSYLTANSRYDAEGMLNGFVGGTLFIGIFLSIIFMLGTVLVIYYKQISEGYEDRERFVILQKIGLDDLQVKQTIRKQVLTVFFLPLIFAFIHLAFAYHMISLIVRIIGVLNPKSYVSGYYHCLWRILPSLYLGFCPNVSFLSSNRNDVIDIESSSS